MTPGTKLGRYEIRSKLGAGGMGEVYLAHDEKLDRKVALKILPAEVAADRKRMNRFVQEAKAASALNHPNILTIHEIDQTDSGHFIATEFIEGETLRQRIKREQMRISDVLNVAIQTADALSAAHEAGIIHRDVKPENIMLRRRDSIVKVLDFGLAKLTAQPTSAIDPEAPTKSLFRTDEGVVLGTAFYMSPEQARGMTDARTDIWSLGVVVYEMVAGSLPFKDSTASGTLAAILNEKEAPPLARFSREVPGELERIVEKALRKDREERYQVIKDMLLDLKRLKQRLEVEAEIERNVPPEQFGVRLSGGELSDMMNSPEGRTPTMESVQAQAASTATAAPAISSAEYIVNQVQQHKRGVVTIAAALALVSVAGIVSYFYFVRGGSRPAIDSIAVLPFVNESGNPDNEYLSDGMTETLISSLSQLPNLSVKARSSVFRYQGKATDAKTIGKELNVQAILNGRVVQRGDQLTLSLELTDTRTENVIWSEQYNRKQSDLVTLQTEIARDVSQKLKTKLSGADEQKLAKDYTHNTEAYQLYLKGRFYWNRRTVPDLQRSIEYFNQAIAIDRNYALAYAGLSNSYSNLAENAGTPPDTLTKARDAARTAILLDDNLAEAHAALAQVIKSDYDFAGAEREYKRALELNSNYATAHQWYGNLLSVLGRHEESLAELRRALDLDPFSLIINKNYGDSLRQSRRYDESIEQLKKTIELNPNFPQAHKSLHEAYLITGKYVECVEEFAKYQELLGEPEAAALARESYRRNGWQGFLRLITGEDQPIEMWSSDLAIYYVALGDKEKAFNQLDRAAREGRLLYLQVEPLYDPLRDDARFQELLRSRLPAVSGT